MTFSLVQLFIALFALFAISRTVIRARARTIPYLLAALWSGLWLAILVVALLPKTTDILAARVGIGRGVDLLVYLSIVALFFLLFRLVVQLEATQQELTKLVRALALRDMDES